MPAHLTYLLNASSNNISGTVPPSIGHLRTLNDLSLFSNQISGSLPLELGSISPLRHLRMQDNRLDANFTEFATLGDLRQLITLDLYNNQMTGEVPASIQNLTSMQYLYLDNEHYKPLRQKCAPPLLALPLPCTLHPIPCTLLALPLPCQRPLDSLLCHASLPLPPCMQCMRVSCFLAMPCCRCRLFSSMHLCTRCQWRGTTQPAALAPDTAASCRIT